MESSLVPGYSMESYLDQSQGRSAMTVTQIKVGVANIADAAVCYVCTKILQILLITCAWEPE